MAHRTPRRPGWLFRNERLVVIILMATVLTSGFYATDAYMASGALQGRKFWHPSLPWDDAIPLSPGWIWVYFLYFPLCFFPAAWKPLRSDIGVFRRIAAGFCIQFGLALAAFWCLPSQMMHPALDAVGPSSRALAWFYIIDPGFNVFPSLHVANAAYVACLIGRVAGAGWTILGWGLCLLIAASTLFVKQHYLLDLPAGLFLGVLGYRLAFSDWAVSLSVPERQAQALPSS